LTKRSLERRKAEVRRITLPRTPVNKDKEKGQGTTVAWPDGN
jgi:hypothetical protein